MERPNADVIEDCAVPDFHACPSFDYPVCSCNNLRDVIHTHRSLFMTVPGGTEVACHYITTTGTPVRVPPHHILAHYRQEIEKLINTMLEQGIIEEQQALDGTCCVHAKEIRRNSDVN